MIRVVIIGYQGRMGREITRAHELFDDIEIVGGVEKDDHPWLEGYLGKFDCAVDFSIPEATLKALDLLTPAKIPIVIGTTGFDEEGKVKIRSAAEEIPIFSSPNMAYGINLLIEWLPNLIQKLDDFDIEITETHHNQKRDAPSGTAKRIFEAIKGVRPEAKPVHHRGAGPRSREEIGLFSLRGGDVYGVHTISLFGPGEEITITHRALSRKVFAIGALKAVRFIVDKKPGLYSFSDLLRWGS
ncbi:4-hydroxy-tetrahydrodipicolinate reductase [candidate division WOR-3 bacterium]|uniref:4-hydroxy-tetrahydrodipicolinate reductase n=1 Tax=candidate division WOR-3 bacterium TaxID=2052148 RepID=A0A660SD96_UNCW3|nr:MAG: 4-hydroxy-tetrahydrodipicolinate reductase [candidate division WOR-3 bacterium]